MFGLLIGVAALVLIPVMAAKGSGYRGAYLGFAILMFIAALFVATIFVGAEAPAGTPDSTVRGIKAMNDIGPGLTMALAGMGLGCLMGAAFWRPGGAKAGAVVALRCVACQHRNPVGPSTCEKCGASLNGSGSIALTT